ncbi:hypothetical protein JCM3775_000606 [Rhodotorula graminis]|uniref:Uncharacterized protein n=1 Tax=Rhodotorula graminis (strain WP1) TaxID=578459 RepID=A0A0P9EWX3_RHOGW|nr:uncharacterized protein RHOBADRAFT_54459 [Rhodotorula graminis WP1]KPV73865.1 hypothetical protein RHOBADRAFT_54459 [Rhodotorula graminis WP1]
MAESPPTGRSRSGSTGLGRPALPLAMPPSSSSSPRDSQQATSPSSALSQSLKAFADLALHDSTSPAARNPLDSAEFREAFQHARRASFGATNTSSAVTTTTTTQPNTVPALSTSPSSSSEAGSVPTPSSSPPSSTLSLPKTRSGAPTSTTASTKAVRAPSSTLGGVCERPELEFEQRGGSLALDDDDLAADPCMSAPAARHIAPAVTPPAGSAAATGGGIFAGGARWGWPGTVAGSANAGPLSPPAVEPFSLGHGRRGSFSFGAGSSTAASAAGIQASTSPGAASSSSSSAATVLATSPPAADPLRMMQPLGRVVSAGAALQTAQDGGKNGVGDGLGLFRRFSISGIGARKNRAVPSSPPSSGFSAQPAPTLLEPTHATLPPPVPTSASATAEPTRRGRTLSPPVGAAATGTRGKRRISPMGEKILRGGY